MEVAVDGFQIAAARKYADLTSSQSRLVNAYMQNRTTRVHLQRRGHSTTEVYLIGEILLAIVIGRLSYRIQ